MFSVFKDHEFAEHIIQYDHYEVGRYFDNHIVKVQHGDKDEHDHPVHHAGPEPACEKVADLLEDLSLSGGRAVEDHSPVCHVGEEDRQGPGDHRGRHDAQPQDMGAEPVRYDIDDRSEYSENKVKDHILIFVPIFSIYGTIVGLLYLLYYLTIELF